MFRKKKEEMAVDGEMLAPPMKPFTKKGTHAPSKPPTAPTFHPDIPRRASPDIPAVHTRQAERVSNDAQESKRLLIGRSICLNGEITSCNQLVVEGRAEVTLRGAHALEVTDSGYFKGFADVQVADISGHFEGELVVHEQLILRAGGRIDGTVRYGRIVIEAGGKVSGDLQALDVPGTNEEGVGEGGNAEPKPKTSTDKT